MKNRQLVLEALLRNTPVYKVTVTAYNSSSVYHVGLCLVTSPFQVLISVMNTDPLFTAQEFSGVFRVTKDRFVFENCLQC